MQTPDHSLANLIRDTVVHCLKRSYEWETGSHALEISFRSAEESLRTFRLTGLSQLEISEDFTAMHVASCTVLRSTSRVYLSLDPYHEGVESDEDNYSFVGREMVQIDAGASGGQAAER